MITLTPCSTVTFFFIRFLNFPEDHREIKSIGLKRR